MLWYVRIHTRHADVILDAVRVGLTLSVKTVEMLEMSSFANMRTLARTAEVSLK